MAEGVVKVEGFEAGGGLLGFEGGGPNRRSISGVNHTLFPPGKSTFRVWSLGSHSATTYTST